MNRVDGMAAMTSDYENSSCATRCEDRFPKVRVAGLNPVVRSSEIPVHRVDKGCWSEHPPHETSSNRRFTHPPCSMSGTRLEPTDLATALLLNGVDGGRFGRTRWIRH